MFKITKLKPEQKAYSDNSAANGSQSALKESQGAGSGGFRIYKIQQTAKPTVSTSVAANKTGSTYAPRSTSQWREVGGGRVSTKTLPVTVPSGEVAEKRDSGKMGLFGGALKTYAGSGLNTAGVALEGLGKLNTMAANSYNAGAVRNAQSYIERDRKLLAAATDAKERQRLEQSIERQQRNLDLMRGTTEFHESLSRNEAQKIYENADELTTSGTQDIENAKSGMGKVGQLAVDVGVAGTQMAADMGLAVLTGGSALVPMAIRSFGGGAQDARLSGASYGQQLAYGTGNAALQVGTEKMFNIAAPFKKMFGAGVLDKALEKTTAKLTGSAVGRAALSALSEASEETVAGVLDPLLRAATLGETPEWDAGQILEESLVGGILGLAGSGGEAIMRRTGRNTTQEAAGAAQTPPASKYTPSPQVKTAGVQEFTPEDFADIEAEPKRNFAEEMELHDDIPVNDNPAALVPVADALGQSGKKAMMAFYDGDVDTDLYAKDFVTAYNAGLNGNPRPTENYVSAGKAVAAYIAGQNDAKVYGKDAGLVRDEYSSSLDGAVMDELDQVSKMLGVKVKFADSVHSGKANAQIQDGIISIEKNNPNPVRFLFGHEITHRMQELSPKSYEAFRSAAMEIVGGADAIQARMENYAAGGVTLSESQAMDELSADYAGHLIEDRDMLKTFIAQNQQNRTLLQKIGDAIRAIAEKLTGRHKDLADNAASLLEKAARESTRRVVQLTAKSTARVDGAVNYSINRNFAAEIQSWFEGGQKGDDSFTLGSTGPVLQGLGAIESDIYMNADKVSTIMRDHPEMTLEEIKRIPQILEDPVLVLKSKGTKQNGNNSRLVLFGSVKAQNGKTVMTVLDLLPREGRLLLDDMQKVNSAYTKDNPAGFITSSEILFADKKRTIPLLRSSGLTIASQQLLRNGSIGSISYAGGNIKLSGENFYDVVNTPEGKASFSMKGADSSYAAMVEKYGAIKLGEKPVREVQVPQRTAENKKVSQTVRTVMEAGATPDAALPTIEEMVEKGDFSYEVYSDKQAISDATARITDKGYSSALMDWTKDVHAGKVSKENTATGWALYNAAANAGDMKTAMNVLTDMVGHQRNAAQAVQATRILKQMPADAQLYTVQRSVSNLEQELKDRYGDEAPGLKIDEELAEKFRNAEDQTARDVIMQDIYRSVGKQMPSRFIDKWNAWRYLAMLGNPRTHVRNVLGNAFFAPVVGAKNVVAAGIEAGVSKATGGKIDRSKGFVGIGKSDRALLSAATKDYAAVQEQALGGGKYTDLQNANKYIEEGRTIFQPGKITRNIPGAKLVAKGLETARKANGTALDTEDVWFSRPHYAAALAQYCKANGITAEQVAAGKGDKLEKGRAYAIREAQKATYRDTNMLSNLFSRRFREDGEYKAAAKLANTVMEGILPFRKTPANILARGIEYSPIGLMNGIKKAALDVQSGRSTAAEAIDSISAGLTGTGILALGAYLAAQGFLRGAGGGDDKEKKFDELQGHQAYSMELPDGSSVSLDWLAPEVLPMFVGVNLYEQTVQQNEDVTMDAILSAVGNVTAPLLEMSCLQSLNDVFDAVGYASSNDMDGLSSALASAATSYITQAFPTVFGQIERTTEDQRMTTYTEKNGFLTADMQYTLGKISGKTPGEYHQIPYIDAWGRTESTGGTGKRAFNNFLNPAYTSTVDSSAMEQELQRLYDATGEAGVFPSRADKKITVDGVDKYLTAEEYVTYAVLKGQKSYELLHDLATSTAYQKLSEDEKVKSVKDAYDLANKTAKAAVSDYKPDSWMQNAAEAEKKYHISSETYLTLRSQTSGIESLKDKNGDTIANSKSLLIMQEVYSTPGLSDKQRQAMFEYLGVGKTVRHWNKALVKEKLAAMRK